jgi:hypothetical protein
VNNRAEAPGTHRVTLALGASHADFHRLFPHVVAPQVPYHQGLRSSVRWPDGATVEIELSRENTRKIAGLRLVYLDVVLSFTGFDAVRQAAFMQRFQRSFHKGGG